MSNDDRDMFSDSGQTIEKEFTLESTKEILKSMVANYSTDLAGKYATILKDKIDGVDLSVGKNNELSRIPDTTYGRQLYEGMTSMVKKGGEALIAVVKTNFPLDDFLEELNVKTGENDTRAIPLKNCIAIDLCEPQKSIFDTQAEVYYADKEKELKLFYEEKWHTAVTEWNATGVFNTRSSKLKEPAAEFSLSAEYEQMLTDLVVYKKDIVLSMSREFLTEAKEYSVLLKRKNEAKMKLATMKADHEKDLILHQLAHGLQLALVRVSNKTKSAVRDFPNIIEKLKGRVRLPTGETLTDPYGSENVSGMYYLLYQEFNKTSLVIFNNMLIEIMSHELKNDVCVSKPTQGVIDIISTLKAWNQMELWSYMNKDHFFVVCLLRSYAPESDVRKEAFKEVTNYMRKREVEENTKNFDNNMGQFEEMPIFSHITEWIQNVYVQTQIFSPHKKTETPKNPYYGKNFVKKAPAQHGTDSAAAVEEPVKGNKPFVELKRATGPYTSEVKRSANLACVDPKNGTQHSYTATKEVCALCSGTGKKHNRPFCFLGKCSLCSLFGHRRADCLQKLSVSANSVEEDVDESAV